MSALSIPDTSQRPLVRVSVGLLVGPGADLTHRYSQRAYDGRSARITADGSFPVSRRGSLARNPFLHGPHVCARQSACGPHVCLRSRPIADVNYHSHVSRSSAVRSNEECHGR